MYRHHQKHPGVRLGLALTALLAGFSVAAAAAAAPSVPAPVEEESPPPAGEPKEEGARSRLLERANRGAAEAAAAGAVRQEAAEEQQMAGEAGQEEQEELEEPDIIIRYAEEIQVTGTAIRETPIDSPASVAVLNRDTLVQQGAPQLVDMFKNLTISSGVLGEVNSWYGGATNVPETVANVNLRGLGASRTLVLINGRRTAYLPAQLPGGRYVDVNTIPSIAIERLDVLKEGAGAIYGSDAVGGVVNFITRNRFEGMEIQASHEYYSGGGDSRFAGIWGHRFGTANLTVALEHQRRQQLSANERDFVLRDYPNWWWGWSGIGNPGSFIVPAIGAGSDAAALSAAPRFVDPDCEAFGGYTDNGVRSCRFRYQAWDALIYGNRHTRGLVTLSGDVGEHGHYRIEGLYADGRTPSWETTPSFPPVSQFNQLQVVGPDHPGRRALVANNPTLLDTAENPLDLTGTQPWYFYGRLVGNSGPGRILSSRQSATQRIAASLGGELGGTELHYDLGAVYARSTGDVGQPAEYAYRKFLAFRGYGGPGCGVGVVVDPDSPTRMALGEVPAGTVAGQGNCMYYNPFSNGLESAAQPGAPLEGGTNPRFSGAGNPQALLDWIGEEVIISSTSDLFTADATLNGNLNDNVSYAVGYQFRRVSASGRPNDAGNLSLNPCFVPGDSGCAIQTGQFTFTTARNPYDAQQTTHAAFTEFALSLGDRLDAQVAAHYERYDFADSWDPKVSMIWSLSDIFALRGTVQTSFRTPSLDDVNEDLITLLDWVGASGTWKAIDDRGNTELVPEEAFTYNIGLTAQDEDSGLEATLDFWSFDFDNPIGTLPHSGLATAYANPATRAAVQSRIVCPGGVTDGSCSAVDIERIRVNRINWPGLKTSGLDWHFGLRRVMGLSVLVFNFDGSYTLDYTVDSLDYNGVELQASEQAAGYYNRTNPLAPPLPRVRSNAIVNYLFGNFTLTGVGRYISGYEDRETVADYENIDAWITFDATAQYRVPHTEMVLTLSGLNLAGSFPPLVNHELAYDALTHNPKGRRFKLDISYKF